MTSRILASHLMRTANKLVPASTPAGRPAWTDLRRATSTAYYAVFHQILRHGALVVLPRATEEDIAKVARWQSHAAIKKAADSVVRAHAALSLGAGPAPREYRAAVDALIAASRVHGALPQQLVDAATLFSILQDARQTADYDGEYDPTRRETRIHISDAQTALDNLWELWTFQDSEDPVQQEAHESYRVFLLLALGWSSSFARMRP